MLTAKLAQKAKKDSERSNKLMSWKLSNSLIKLTAYLYWRNRYPLILKLTTRVLLITEILLINHYFNFYLASSFGFIFFTFYYLKELQRGLTQSIKKEVVFKKISKNKSDTYQYLKSQLKINLIYGFLCATALFGYAILTQAQHHIILFLGFWLIIFPLQLIAGSLWSILYGFHRLRRSFWLIICARAMPLICLIAFGSFLGVYAYLAGFFIGRLIENSYLSLVSWQAIKKQINRHSTAQKINSIWKNYSQILLPVFFPVYNILIATLLYLRDQGEWLEHFFIIYMLNISLFITLRGPQSLMMDFYQSLLKLDLINAKKWLKISFTIRNIAILLFCTLLIALFYFNIKYNLGFEIFSAYLPAITGLVVVRSILLSRILIAQSGFLEKLYIKSIASALLVISIIQIYLLLVVRANLLTIYYAEIVVTILYLFFSRTLLNSKTLAEDSEVYIFKKQFLKKNQSYSVPEEIFSKINSKAYNFILCQIDAEYESKQKRAVTLNKLSESLGSSDYLIPVYPGIYFIATEDSNEVNDLVNRLKFNNLAIIRSAEVIFLDNFKESIIKINRQLKLTQQKSGKINQLNTYLSKLLKDFPLNKFEKLKLDTPKQEIVRFLKQEGFKDLKLLAEGEKIAKELTTEHIYHALSRFKKLGFTKYLLNSSTKNYLEFFWQGRPIIVVDSSNLSDQQKEKLKVISWGINLYLLFGLLSRREI